MDKKRMIAAAENIVVPKDKVFHALEKGLKRADSGRGWKKKAMYSSGIAAAILGLTFTSALFSPAMNQVLANTPLLGSMFQEFGDAVGVQLASQNNVSELNQSVKKNGVTVQLTSAYFDGNIVSVTGLVHGEVEKGHNEEGELSFDMNFDKKSGDNDPWQNGMKNVVSKVGDEYYFQWQMNYPHATIKDQFTLPITIHNINGIKGEWNFEVPVQQEKSDVLKVNHEKVYEKDKAAVLINELAVAKASSSLLFEKVTEYEKDDITLWEATDDKGRKYSIDNASLLSITKKQDGYHRSLRAPMTKVPKDVETLTFYPTLMMEEPFSQQLLDKTAFRMNSVRSDLKLKVNSVKVNGEKLIVDYHFLGMENPSKHMLDLLNNNLSNQFTLIDKDYVAKVDPDNPVPPANHSVRQNKVTLLDKKSAHFQSVFDLNGKERISGFKLQNTMLQFNFSSFIEPKELEPFTVEIN